MFYRKDAVFMAVAGILASAGFAVADTTPTKAPLTLDPVATEAAPSGPLMMGLDKVGVGDPLKKAGLNIYGWVEAGYTYSNRHHTTAAPLLPGPNNHEFGGGSFPSFGGGDRNHFMLNQVDIRFERLVRSDKWDVGGLIEVMYGTDAAGIHSNGLAMGNDTYNGSGGTNWAASGFSGGAKRSDDRFNPQYQFDITQAYVDVNVPVGNGLKVRVGKFVDLMGYEAIDPRGNPFYSHSYLFSALPSTFTGVLAFYTINDQWSVAGGISRGWDQSLEDNNGSAIDTLGEVIFTPNKQWQARLSWTVGPENDTDSSHYRTAIDGIVSYKATEQLSFGFEGLYIYDGGVNADGFASSFNHSHAYGDQWGFALYGAYKVNDYATVNLRLEKFHDFSQSLLDSSLVSQELNVLTNFNPTSINVYDVTVGVTVHPFPKDAIGKNLVIRPEARYSYSEDHIFVESNGTWKDQLTFGCDVIFGF